MTLKLNGVEIDDLRVNGVKADKGYLNGTKVYTRFTKSHTVTVGYRQYPDGLENINLVYNGGNIEPSRVEGYTVNQFYLSTTPDIDTRYQCLVGTSANPASDYLRVTLPSGEQFMLRNINQNLGPYEEFNPLFSVLRDAYNNNPDRKLDVNLALV